MKRAHLFTSIFLLVTGTMASGSKFTFKEDPLGVYGEGERVGWPEIDPQKWLWANHCVDHGGNIRSVTIDAWWDYEDDKNYCIFGFDNDDCEGGGTPHPWESTERMNGLYLNFDQPFKSAKVIAGTCPTPPDE